MASFTEEHPGPYRDFGAAGAYDTMELQPPIRVPVHSTGVPAQQYSHQGGAAHTGGTPLDPRATHNDNAAYAAPVSSTAASGKAGLMSTQLVVVELCLRIAAAVSLLIAGAVMASVKQNYVDVDGVVYTVSVSSLDATKYGVAASFIGLVYSIYQIVSSIVRLLKGGPMLPGNISALISYIGDQVLAVFLMSAGTSPASVVQYAHEVDVCSTINTYCNQVAGATAVIFIGFAFVAASSIISTYCFYRNKL